MLLSECAVTFFSVILGVSALSSSPRNVLIVQNKGGGHGEIGFHLSKSLYKLGSKVTLLQDSGCEKTKQPFCQYGELTGNAEIIYQKLSDIESVKSFVNTRKFDTIIDNNSKSVDAAKVFTDALKSQGGNTEYMYVSSGGMYKGECPPGGFPETASVKADNECRIVEEFVESAGVSWTSFRPQYIYGSSTNKRSNLDWFLDRITNKVPICIPGDGSQLVALSNCADVAELIASCVGNAAASNQVFNAGTDKFLSYSEVVRIAAAAAGVSESGVEVVYYDPKVVTQKTAFPFRATSFTVSPAKAKEMLGWNPKSDLTKDMSFWFAQYLALGMTQPAAPDFSQDKAVLAAIRGSV